MEELLSNELLLNITEQLILLSAFLGGFSATFLAAILVFDSQKRMTNWIVISSALSACSFIVCACTSIALVNGLQATPQELEEGLISLRGARIISALSMAIGVFSLLGSIGLSGWLRNKHVGIVTTAIALACMLLVSVVL
jgi:hypothetical protein